MCMNKFNKYTSMFLKNKVTSLTVTMLPFQSHRLSNKNYIIRYGKPFQLLVIGVKAIPKTTPKYEVKTLYY